LVLAKAAPHSTNIASLVFWLREVLRGDSQE